MARSTYGLGSIEKELRINSNVGVMNCHIVGEFISLNNTKLVFCVRPSSPLLVWVIMVGVLSHFTDFLVFRSVNTPGLSFSFDSTDSEKYCIN